MTDQPPPDSVPEPTPPSPPPPVAPARKGLSGCAIAAIIAGGLVVLGLLALAAAFFFGVRRFVAEVDTELTASDSCAFITDSEASDALGVEVSVESGDSAFGAILGIIRDTRLLADQPACFVSSEDAVTQAWISLYQGNDAQAVFAAAEDIADGQVVSSTSDASGSISVETDPFRGETVPGLGDEAFCTEPGPTTHAGVLARSGERVVYVSLLPELDGEGVDIFRGSLCERASSLARIVLLR